MQRKQSEKSLDIVEAFFISENFLIQLLMVPQKAKFCVTP